MGKTWTKRHVKEVYYDPIAINKIGDKIRCKNFSDARLLLDAYIEQYPEDELALLYEAMLMANTGKKQEGKELAELVYEGHRFHNPRAQLKADSLYSNILIDVEEYDKAEELILKIIDTYEYKFDPEDLSIVILNLIQLYSNQYRYNDIVVLIETNSNIRKQPQFIAKLAVAYYYLDRYDEAIELLDKNYSSFEGATRILADLMYGKYHYEKFKRTDVINELLLAKTHLHKSLSKKSVYYYSACYYLADVYRLLGDNGKSIYYADKSLDYRSSHLYVDNIDDNGAYFIKVQLFLKLDDFTAAKYYIDMMDDESNIKTRAIIMYSYCTKDYETCIKYCEKSFNSPSCFYYNANLEYYINSFIRLGQLDKARYILEYIHSLSEDITDDYYEKCSAYLNILEGKPIEIINYYTTKQYDNYNENAAIMHINRKHLNHKDASFESEEQIKTSFDYARENIEPEKGIPNGLMDVHTVKLSNCGIYENGNCHAFKVVAIPGTNNIITMYPVVDFRDITVMEVMESKEQYKNGLIHSLFKNKNDK